MRLSRKIEVTDQEASYISLMEDDIDKLEQEISLLRMEAEHEAIEADHELANFMNYRREEVAVHHNMYRVLLSYVAHFDRHPLNYMSDELNKITQEARKALTR